MDRRVLILGIESATNQAGCAVGGHEGVLAAFHATRGRRHAETLVPAIDFVLRQARVEPEELGAIAVDIGPGLFTGLRVGVATAKAMAQALRLPMIGVPSLDLLAFRVRYSRRLIVAALDARRGELFYAFYRQVPGGVQRVSEHQLGSPGDLVSELEATREEFIAVGDGAYRYADELAGLGGLELGETSLAHPSAAALVELAHPRAIREEFVPVWDLKPLYLRRSDAELQWGPRASV